MTLRELGFYILDTVNVIVLNPEGKLIDMYDGKQTIMEQFLDRKVDKIINATFNTIWVKVF